MCKEFLSVNQSKPCATFRAPAKLQGFFGGRGVFTRCQLEITYKSYRSTVGTRVPAISSNVNTWLWIYPALMSNKQEAVFHD